MENAVVRISLDREITLRYGVEDDLPALLDLYNYSVLNSIATFDLVEQTLEQRKKWFAEHSPNKHPLIVAESERKILGYATLSQFRDKPAYSKSVESSVYVVRDSQRSGVGTALMRRIIEVARKLGYRTIVACIVSPNRASFSLHEKLGFIEVGKFKEVGFKFGAWRDTAWFQLMLEGNSGSPTGTQS